MSKASKTLADVWSGPWLFQGPPAESKFLAEKSCQPRTLAERFSPNYTKSPKKIQFTHNIK